MCSLSHLAHSRSLARTFKHEPVLLHAGKMHLLLNSSTFFGLSVRRTCFVPAACKEAVVRGNCVCVCPVGETGDVIVVDKDLRRSLWGVRLNSNNFYLL